MYHQGASIPPTVYAPWYHVRVEPLRVELFSTSTKVGTLPRLWVHHVCTPLPSRVTYREIVRQKIRPTLFASDLRKPIVSSNTPRRDSPGFAVCKANFVLNALHRF